jgi:hypothetical protein
LTDIPLRIPKHFHAGELPKKIRLRPAVLRTSIRQTLQACPGNCEGPQSANIAAVGKYNQSPILTTIYWQIHTSL